MYLLFPCCCSCFKIFLVTLVISLLPCLVPLLALYWVALVFAAIAVAVSGERCFTRCCYCRLDAGCFRISPMMTLRVRCRSCLIGIPLGGGAFLYAIFTAIIPLQVLLLIGTGLKWSLDSMDIGAVIMIINLSTLDCGLPLYVLLLASLILLKG